MHKGPQVGITIILSVLATILLMVLRLALNADISRIYLPLIAFPVNIFLITVIYPKKLQIPFGKVTATEFAQKIGLRINHKPGFLILLGILLAAGSSMGMLIGSMLSGQYAFDLSRLTLEQVVFAIVPGVWEEVFYRGILMMIFLNIFKDVKKAFIVQSIIFGIVHIYGFQLWDLVDIFSIILMGFTFTFAAHKTNSLIPGMIFHFLHDAFIFLFQVPEETTLSNLSHLIFFLALWGMLGVNILLTQGFVKILNIAQNPPLYDLAKFLENSPDLTVPVE